MNSGKLKNSAAAGGGGGEKSSVAQNQSYGESENHLIFIIHK